MSELWWLWALCSSVLMSMMIYANQIFKMPSSLMMTYRGLVQSLLLLPFFPFFEAPQTPWFWLLGIIQGIMIAYSDKKVFLCSRLFGGEIVASLKPYVIFLVFVLWLIIKPSQFFALLDEPLRFALIVLCLAGVICSLRAICKGKASKEALIMLLPAFLVAAFIDTNNKYMTTLGASAGLPSAIFYYCWITALVSGLPNAIKFCCHRDWRLAFAPRHVVGGLVVVACSVCSNIFKNTAMFYTKNPAYVAAVMSLYPVWIIIWNNFYFRLKNAEQYPRCNLAAVSLLLTAVIALILLQ
ncbi:MAG: hypothetical protein IJ482_00200 [Alphaproteobacteria bacterium]|nr:hypothetical protein [Alphaproteobacteria bacterium]